MRDRLRRFILHLWKPVGVLARHVSVRIIVDWLMSWIGVVVGVCAGGLALTVVYVAQLWNPILPPVPLPWRPPMSSVMSAFIQSVANLPDGRVVSRYNAPGLDPTGGPDYPIVQFGVSEPNDGSVDTPLAPIRWSLERCNRRVVVAGTTSPELEIRLPSYPLQTDACRVRLRYGGVDYGPWTTR